LEVKVNSSDVITRWYIRGFIVPYTGWWSPYIEFWKFKWRIK